MTNIEKLIDDLVAAIGTTEAHAARQKVIDAFKAAPSGRPGRADAHIARHKGIQHFDNFDDALAAAIRKLSEVSHEH